jgi:hypothetical protein
LVSSVKKDRANDTTGPRVTLIPIFVSKCGKDIVVICRIRNVSDEKENTLKHLLSPFRIKIRDHSGPVDVITIMKMQVVVPSCIGSIDNRVSDKNGERAMLKVEETEPLMLTISKVHTRIVKGRTFGKFVFAFLFMPITSTTDNPAP